jgi:nucleotide-binding universal stress UspA family protein
MVPILRSIIHPTDFSDLSMEAFVHALRIALATKSKLYLLHIADPTDDHEWSSFPGVRDLLARWGLIEETAPQSAVAEKLGIRIAKVQLEPQEPQRAIEEFISKHPSELIVIGTHGREGIARWLHGSLAEALSRQTRMMTLFINSSSRGFVDAATGEFSITNILMPIDHEPSPGEALEIIVKFSRALTMVPPSVRFVHVGKTAPVIAKKDSELGSPEVVLLSGDPVNEIVDYATDISADLIAMATAGHHGFLDAMRGSTSERILRRAPCPVLAVPV